MARWGKRLFKELVVGFISGNKHGMEGLGFMQGFGDRKGLFLPVIDWVYFLEPGIS